MKTALACVAALVLQFAIAGAALAARPELPPPGMAKYLVVLWEAGTPIPGDEGKKASGKEPDFAKLGGRLLFSRDNRRIIYLPRGEANGLRRHASVSYVQRIWVGESLADWADPETKNHSRFEVETDATNVSWGPVAYDYDSAGNIKGVGLDKYTYDSAGRLIEAFVGGKTEAYEYDSFGNMTKKGVTGVTATTIQVDGASNRLIGPEYDAAGNLIATGDREEYTYDSLGMMSTSARGTTERRYIYDANEERIGRINDERVSRWTIRDAGGRVLREFKSDDTESEAFWYWEQDYVYADGQLVGGETQAWTGGNSTTYGGRRHYHLDHLSSIRMVTNDSRGAIMRHDYYPFGIEQTAAWQELVNPGDPHVDDARFTGHERDYHGALNYRNNDYLDYMHARYYDPNKGRFLSVDPGKDWDLRSPQSWNMYAYVRNNPLNLVDRNGRQAAPPRACDPGQRCGFAALYQQSLKDDAEADWNDGANAVRVVTPGTVSSREEREAAQWTMTRLAMKYILPFVVPSGGTAVNLAENAVKGEVLAALRGGAGAMTAAQRAGVIRQVGRATTSESVTVVQNANGTVNVLRTRPGVNGSQTFVTQVGRAGNTQTVQTAQNAAGQQVHYDPKGGTSTWKAIRDWFR